MLGLRDSAACVHCGLCESQVHVFFIFVCVFRVWLHDVFEVFCGPAYWDGVLRFLFLSFL